MEFSGIDLVSAITLFLLIFLSTVLISSKKSTTSSRILGTFLLLNALNISGGLLFISDVVLQRTSLAFWTNTLPLMFGPLLWIYTNDILFRDFKYDRKIIWHFIPFILSFLAMVIFYHFQPRERQLEILLMVREAGRTELPVVITTLIFYGHTLTYLILCWISITKYRRELYNRFSSIETINVRWLMLLIGLYAIVIFIALINSLIGFSQRPYIYEISLTGLVIVLLFFASSTLYRALTFPHFFKGIPRHKIRYGRNPLPAETIRDIRTALYEVIDREQLYKKAYLTLEELATRLKTTPRLLSQVLNQEFGLTFFDYVNKKRVYEAQRQLDELESSGKTELEIMYDVGFNSKTSFNNAFRKFTGKSPSDYLEKGLNDS